MDNLEQQTKSWILIRGNKPLMEEGVRAVIAKKFPEKKILHDPVDAAFHEKVLLILCVITLADAVRLLKNCCFVISQVIILADDYTGQSMLNIIGPDRFLLDSASSETLLTACVHLSADGLFLCDYETAQILVRQTLRMARIARLSEQVLPRVEPSKRELEIAGYILYGLDNREIAKKMYLSPGTVKNLISTILEKYGFHARSQIVGLLLL
ncbi:LuxR C-terminal-related transcriptional regulator [Oscillospiraceae bacterium PP1C4]